MIDDLPRKLYLRGVLLWALLLAIFPPWTGRIYSRADGSPDGVPGRWYESGSFGLQGGVDVIDFVQHAPVWRPPRGFFDQISVRWPWQPPSGSNVEISLATMAAEFSLGVIALGVIAHLLVKFRRMPSDRVVTMAWWISLSLAAAWVAILAIGLLTMGYALEGAAVPAVLGLGLVVGIALGVTKIDGVAPKSAESSQSPSTSIGRRFVWLACGASLATCVALAVTWASYWFRGPVSNFIFVRPQWPINLLGAAVILVSGKALAGRMKKRQLPMEVGAGIYFSAIAWAVWLAVWYTPGP